MNKQDTFRDLAFLTYLMGPSIPLGLVTFHCLTDPKEAAYQAKLALLKEQFANAHGTMTVNETGNALMEAYQNPPPLTALDALIATGVTIGTMIGLFGLWSVNRAVGRYLDNTADFLSGSRPPAPQGKEVVFDPCEIVDDTQLPPPKPGQLGLDQSKPEL